MSGTVGIQVSDEDLSEEEGSEDAISGEEASQDFPAEPDSGSPTGGRRRWIVPALATLGVVLGLAGASALTWQLINGKPSYDPLPPISAERALIVSRRVGVAFEDAGETWAAWFRAQRLDPPREAQLVLFQNARPTPCSATSPVGGPFYCPLDSKASYDLPVLDQIEKRMDRDATLGTALIVARVFSEHVQGGLGVAPTAAGPERENFSLMHTLQADCLTGVWAGMVHSRLGTVPVDLYARLLRSGHSVTETFVHGGRPDQPALDIFLHDDFAGRETAFRAGLEARDPAACPRPK